MGRLQLARLCSLVAGDLGELLDEECRVSDDLEWGEGWEADEDGWPTPGERLRRLDRIEALGEALGRAFAGGRPCRYEFPPGECGRMMRYAIAVTGRVLPVTTRLWWAVKGYGEAGTSVSDKARVDSSLLWSAGEAVKPFEQPWPPPGSIRTA